MSGNLRRWEFPAMWQDLSIEMLMGRLSDAVYSLREPDPDGPEPATIVVEVSGPDEVLERLEARVVGPMIAVEDGSRKGLGHETLCWGSEAAETAGGVRIQTGGTTGKFSNRISGNMNGTTVQARDIRGGVNLRSSERAGDGKRPAVGDERTLHVTVIAANPGGVLVYKG